MVYGGIGVRPELSTAWQTGRLSGKRKGFFYCEKKGQQPNGVEQLDSAGEILKRKRDKDGNAKSCCSGRF